MSTYLHYCEVCGQILDHDDIYQICKKDWETKKKQKLFEVCDKCLSNIENKHFEMPKLNKRKPVKFSTIFKKEFATGKVKSLYDLLPEQVDKLLTLKVGKDDLILKTKFNRRYWTEGSIRRLIETSDKHLMDAVVKLYEYQTDDEKKGRKTIHDNAVGFNQPDASFLTGMARLYMDRGLDAMTEKQIAKTRKLTLKYVAQLTILANAN